MWPALLLAASVAVAVFGAVVGPVAAALAHPALAAAVALGASLATFVICLLILEIVQRRRSAAWGQQAASTAMTQPAAELIKATPTMLLRKSPAEEYGCDSSRSSKEQRNLSPAAHSSPGGGAATLNSAVTSSSSSAPQTPSVLSPLKTGSQAAAATTAAKPAANDSLLPRIRSFNTVGSSTPSSEKPDSEPEVRLSLASWIPPRTSDESSQAVSSLRSSMGSNDHPSGPASVTATPTALPLPSNHTQRLQDAPKAANPAAMVAEDPIEGAAAAGKPGATTMMAATIAPAANGPILLPPAAEAAAGAGAGALRRRRRPFVGEVFLGEMDMQRARTSADAASPQQHATPAATTGRGRQPLEEVSPLTAARMAARSSSPPTQRSRFGALVSMVHEGDEQDTAAAEAAAATADTAQQQQAPPPAAAAAVDGLPAAASSQAVLQRPPAAQSSPAAGRVTPPVSPSSSAGRWTPTSRHVRAVLDLDAIMARVNASRAVLAQGKATGSPAGSSAGSQPASPLYRSHTRTSVVGVKVHDPVPEAAAAMTDGLDEQVGRSLLEHTQQPEGSMTAISAAPPLNGCIQLLMWVQQHQPGVRQGQQAGAAGGGSPASPVLLSRRAAALAPAGEQQAGGVTELQPTDVDGLLEDIGAGLLQQLGAESATVQVGGVHATLTKAEDGSLRIQKTPVDAALLPAAADQQVQPSMAASAADGANCLYAWPPAVSTGAPQTVTLAMERLPAKLPQQHQQSQPQPLPTGRLLVVAAGGLVVVDQVVELAEDGVLRFTLPAMQQATMLQICLMSDDSAVRAAEEATRSHQAAAAEAAAAGQQAAAAAEPSRHGSGMQMLQGLVLCSAAILVLHSADAVSEFRRLFRSQVSTVLDNILEEQQRKEQQPFETGRRRLSADLDDGALHRRSAEEKQAVRIAWRQHMQPLIHDLDILLSCEGAIKDSMAAASAAAAEEGQERAAAQAGPQAARAVALPSAEAMSMWQALATDLLQFCICNSLAHSALMILQIMTNAGFRFVLDNKEVDAATAQVATVTLSQGLDSAACIDLAHLQVPSAARKQLEAAEAAVAAAAAAGALAAVDISAIPPGFQRSTKRLLIKTSAATAAVLAAADEGEAGALAAEDVQRAGPERQPGMLALPFVQSDGFQELACELVLKPASAAAASRIDGAGAPAGEGAPAVGSSAAAAAAGLEPAAAGAQLPRMQTSSLEMPRATAGSAAYPAGVTSQLAEEWGGFMPLRCSLIARNLQLVSGGQRAAADVEATLVRALGFREVDVELWSHELQPGEDAAAAEAEAAAACTNMPGGFQPIACSLLVRTESGGASGEHALPPVERAANAAAEEAQEAAEVLEEEAVPATAAALYARSLGESPTRSPARSPAAMLPPGYKPKQFLLLLRTSSKPLQEDQQPTA